eukprot:s3223_g12.t1
MAENAANAAAAELRKTVSSKEELVQALKSQVATAQERDQFKAEMEKLLIKSTKYEALTSAMEKEINSQRDTLTEQSGRINDLQARCLSMQKYEEWCAATEPAESPTTVVSAADEDDDSEQHQ